jgi:iron complex outermembrane receptor protein
MTFARDDVPQQRLSPANLSTQFPTPIGLGGTSGSIQSPGALNFFVRNNVPANNPGLADIVAQCATNPVALAAGVTCASLATAVAAGGVDISQTTWRAIAHAGHPTNSDKADRQTIDSKAFRVSAGLTGEVFETLNWDTAFTYMNSRSDVGTNDLLVDRIQLALNGFGENIGDGGDGCSPADRAALGTTSTVAQHAARGCFFFNPFTNSIAVSAVNGAANPFYRGDANPAVINNPKLVEWLYGHYDNKFTAEIFVADGVVSGPTGLELPGGDLAFALGTQFRYTTDKNEYGDLFNNRVNPCVDSIDDDTPVCGAPAGPLIFFGSNNNSSYTRGVWAGFGELQIPVLDSLDFSLALRYESYPGELGSTTDPKLSVRWQALDWFALRGSVGTTFRAPTPTQVDPGCATGVANIGGQYRAVETCGNSSLKPETADAINLGLIFNPGNFTATLDYFKFKFEGELINESASRLYATMFPTGGNIALPSHPCNDASFLPLKNRFQFAGGVCDPTQVLRIQVNTVNGPSTDTSGFDLRLQYDWRQALGGSVSLGAEATYLIEYARGAFTLKGTSVEFAAAEDRAGKHDLVAQFFSYPQLRGNVFVSYRWQDLAVRLQTRYTEGTEGAFGTPLNRWTAAGTQEPIGKTDDYIQHDLVARYATPFNATVGFSIQNLLDEDPSDAPSQFNYDYTNGNPLGRVFEVSLQAKF